MKGGLGGMLKQAQKMQENMQKMQDELANIIVEGKSGGGLVKVSMTCRHDVKSISIDPELLKEDKEVLEDLIAAAVNDAVRQIEKTSADKMSSVTGGINIPGMKLPF